MIVQCPYCGEEAALMSGKVIYPHRKDLAEKRFWQCEPCDAYVGCHPNTTKPMGRLANRSLRQWKMMAHAHFDPMFKTGKMTRTEAYAWLAQRMGLHKGDCHIGMFNEEQCAEVVRLIEQSKEVP